MPSIATPDFSALTAPVSRDALRAFRRERGQAGEIGIVVLVCVFAVVFCGALALAIGLVAGGALETSMGIGGRGIGIAIGILLGLGVGTLVVYR